VVSIVFGRQEWAKGARLALHLYEPPYPDEECIVHTYELGGRTLGAFQSNCASWTRNGYDILIFGVGFRNRSQLPLTIRLRNFVLISRDGRAFSPVNVRSEARFPPLFLPETQKLPPGGTWRGFVTFDGRVPGIVPASINYIDDEQTLRIRFQGRHRTALPS
jgi:hypothetical protein